jgi:uncharacterized membrane protein
MALLIVAALVWVGVHVGIAGTRLRDAVVAKIGKGPWAAVHIIGNGDSAAIVFFGA